MDLFLLHWFCLLFVFSVMFYPQFRAVISRFQLSLSQALPLHFVLRTAPFTGRPGLLLEKCVQSRDGFLG